MSDKESVADGKRLRFKTVAGRVVGSAQAGTLNIAFQNHLWQVAFPLSRQEYKHCIYHLQKRISDSLVPRNDHSTLFSRPCSGNDEAQWTSI
jgi:hypothetical protein